MVTRSGERVISTQKGSNADLVLEPDGTGEVRTSSPLEVGGSGSGQSDIQGGLVINEAGGATAADNTRIETGLNANAFVVDAENEKITLGVVLKLPVLGGAPGTLENGMIWAESDGIHYYDGTSEYTLDMTVVP